MTLYQFLRTLAARWKVIAATMTALLVGLFAVVLLVPAKYTGEASVLVSNQSEDPLLGALTQTQLSTSFVSTQVDIINSPRVAREVVAQLKLASSPETVDAWRDDTDGKGDINDWVGARLLAKLKVKPGRDSNVITIAFTSKDPRFAAAIANAFAQSYLRSSVELKIEPARQSAQFFELRIAELRTQLEQAQARLGEAQKEVGLVITPERIDVENGRLADLSGQLALAQSMQADSSSRSKGAAGNAAGSPDVIQNGVVQSLKTQIAMSESKLKELSGQLGPNHPQYLRAQQELDDLRASLARESSQVGSSLNTASRVGVDRVSDLQKAVEDQRQRIIDISQKRDRLSVLQREVDSADKAYQLVMERFAQTTIESHVAQADVALLTSAEEPTDPSFPRVQLFLILTVVFGLFLGIGIALLVEVFNPMVHTAADISLQIGVPVFAVVPALKTRRARLMQWLANLRSRPKPPLPLGRAAP